ncbi:MAG: serine/threonine protein kinase, partial [Myxococcales bacterium]|nr:serine/threonine protein kinase [Myxococcales bacterium]
MGIEQPQDEQEPGLTGAAGADPSGGEEASSTRTRRPSLEIVLDAIPGRPSQSVPPELPTLREFGRYELLGRLAIGGMAEIFLARERSEVGGSRHLVVKVIRPEFANDPEFSELFLNEGKLALGLRHPNICHVYEFGIHNDHPFIAMEVVVGISLFDLLRRSARASRRIPLPVSVKVIAEVAEALHSAHGAKDPRGRSLGLVHQDVSPHNIMLGYDGVVKLLDFGVARSSLDEPESP